MEAFLKERHRDGNRMAVLGPTLPPISPQPLSGLLFWVGAPSQSMLGWGGGGEVSQEGCQAGLPGRPSCPFQSAPHPHTPAPSQQAHPAAAERPAWPNSQNPPPAPGKWSSTCSSPDDAPGPTTAWTHDISQNPPLLPHRPPLLEGIGENCQEPRPRLLCLQPEP